MTPLRADAARSRERILEAARRHDPRDLRLNDVAREAGVGVGTVYRHFATAHALVEALTFEALDRLAEVARTAAARPDPGHAFETALRAVLDLHLESGGLQAVLLANEDMSEEVAALKSAILTELGSLLERAQAAGVVRPDVSPEQVQRLVCGIEYAVRLGTLQDRDVFVDTLLAGLRAH
ncbi:TetR family transcriptional regulator [Streptomonospora sp. S1-112]|uniref:TetR family transcriptional regulator n=1 Tax=Streptomonospora mangrovi TaxID=2883123 RepID=A0A9X3NQD7_9ACTN|nr:TetR family transcriptional regulator [Streptomonospora mangrovi]MDA0566433.1 TetR family transcriptional regulator [Streptomonospora mangrovi]